MAKRKAAKVRRFVVDHDRVFLSSFGVVIGGTKQQAFEWYCRKIGEDPAGHSYATGPGSKGACFFNRRHKNFVLWFRAGYDRPTPEAVETLAHEAYHAAAHVMRHAGVKGGKESGEEALAYYLGYVVRETAALLWPKRKG